MVYNKYYKDYKPYYSLKKQKKVRAKYQFWRNRGKDAAKYGKWWGWQFAPEVGATIDNWNYRRHLYNNKVRTYKVIGSRPRVVVGSRPY